MRHKTTNRDIFERESQTADKWQYLDNSRVATLAEKFLRVTLKMLNVLVHLIEEVNPNVHMNKGGIALPGSPVRRKTQGNFTYQFGLFFYDRLRPTLFMYFIQIFAHFALNCGVATTD